MQAYLHGPICITHTMHYPKYWSDWLPKIYSQSSQPVHDILIWYWVFWLTCNNPRCNKASIQFINSIKSKWWIMIQWPSIRTYTKCETSVPSTLFCLNNQRSGYWNLADIYQQLILEIHKSIYNQLPIGKSPQHIPHLQLESIIGKISHQHKKYIASIDLPNWFIVITLDRDAPCLEEEKTYKLYTRDDLLNPKQPFPTRIWTQEQLDSMFATAQKELSF